MKYFIYLQGNKELGSIFRSIHFTLLVLDKIFFSVGMSDAV